ncbi:MAG: c-type cytochrome [Acidobacteria bacterium]|nr:c-type cytochrome [Acidobacteriota bacterium]
MQSNRSWITVGLLVVVCAITLVSCAEPVPEGPVSSMPIGASITIEPPLGLPPVPVPADNPPTAETIALGRKLYYDKTLSVDKSIACASCHRPDAGFADPDQFSSGVGGKKGGRQAPTVINAAYFNVQFWDGRSPSLEEQALGPMANPIEMAHTLEELQKILSKDPGYVAEFEKAFGPGGVTMDRAKKAIASFERTVLSGNSPFDRFMYGGEADAISESAKRGLEVFRDPAKGNCNVCHAMQEGSALFTDNKFHNLGVGAGLDGTLADIGRFEVTKNEADRGAFKTPGLRNIAETAPYMHDGSLKTLKEVIDFYIGAGNSNEWRAKDLKELDHLTGQERTDLEEFLKSLSAEMPAGTGAPTD